MRKSPSELKVGDHLTVMTRSIVRVVDIGAGADNTAIGSRTVRIEHVKPFANCDELAIDGSVQLDVWEAATAVDR